MYRALPSDQTLVADLMVAFPPSTLIDGNRPASRSTLRYGRSAGADPMSPIPSARRVQPSSSSSSSIRRRCEPPSIALARSSDTVRARSSAGAPRSFATAVTNARSVTPIRGSAGTSRAAPLIARPSAKIVDGLDARDRRLEPGQAEELRHGGCIRRNQHQIASELSHVLEAGNDRPEPTRIHEADPGEIQRDLQRLARRHLPHALEIGRASGRERV